MKKSIIISLSILLLAGPAHAQHEGKDTFSLSEIGLNVGYAFENLKGENSDAKYRSVPVNLYFGFHMNPLFGLENHSGELQVGVEPYVAPIIDPEGGVEAGLSFMLKYAYPIFESLSIYTEVGGGPMYLGVDTFEQGKAGFNFIDQGGAGLQYFFEENKSINLGYRFRHISNADIRDDNNAGINTHSIFAGFSLFY